MPAAISPKHAFADAFPEPLPELYRTLLYSSVRRGAAKGTQGKALGAVPRFFHCACGDVFRSLDTRTQIGRSFLDYSSRGALVPSELTVELWKVQIQHNVEAHRFKPDLDYLVLDGIPRSVEQAQLMRSYIDVKKVFHLACPNREELVVRLKKRALKDNRLDDANESRDPPAARYLRSRRVSPCWNIMVRRWCRPLTPRSRR